MSDLISRSALLQMLKYNKAIREDETGETRQLIAVDIDKMIEYVEKMPTAYDVEKIEKENEALKNRCRILTSGAMCFTCPLECKNRTAEFRGECK